MKVRKNTISLLLSGDNTGGIFFPADFRGEASQAAIKMALSRAVKNGRLERLAHGIYFVPMVDPVMGPLTPSPEAVALLLADREKVRIRPIGAFALHRLGLTTQMPTRLVYLTDGHPRKLKIGKATVEFRATTPKKMALAGEISGPLILALEDLDLAKIDLVTEKKILKLLQAEKRGILEQDLKLASGKVYDYLTKLIKQLRHDGMA